MKAVAAWQRDSVAERHRMECETIVTPLKRPERRAEWGKTAPCPSARDAPLKTAAIAQESNYIWPVQQAQGEQQHAGYNGNFCKLFQRRLVSEGIRGGFREGFPGVIREGFPERFPEDFPNRRAKRVPEGRKQPFIRLYWHT